MGEQVEAHGRPRPASAVASPDVAQLPLPPDSPVPFGFQPGRAAFVVVHDAPASVVRTLLITPLVVPPPPATMSLAISHQPSGLLADATSATKRGCAGVSAELQVPPPSDVR